MQVLFLKKPNFNSGITNTNFQQGNLLWGQWTAEFLVISIYGDIHEIGHSPLSGFWTKMEFSDRKIASKCVCVRERDRESKRESERVCVRACVCVCVRERERERESERTTVAEKVPLR